MTNISGVSSTAAPAPAPAPVATDADLGEVAVLLGPDATDLLVAALAPSNGELLSARAHDVSWWPGRSVTVAYDARVRWADGTTTSETLVAAAGSSVPEGALGLEHGDLRIGLWRAPFDPALPGFAPVLDPGSLSALLEEVGVVEPPAALSTRILAYRPGRRVVVEVTGERTRLFCKVVRPHKARGIHERHRLLRPHLPVPESLGWSAQHGVVALQALPGRTVRESFATGDPLPGPGAVLGLLDALPEPADGARSWGWRASELGAVVAASVPSLARRVEELAARLDAAEDALDAVEHPTVPVHGDLHDAQLLVEGGRITGLLDVDTHARGRRLDDLANSIGHLSTLATAVPHGEVVRDHARELLDAYDAEVDPVALRRGVASVVLGLATGPFRVLEHGWPDATAARVELAEMWAASADDLEDAR